jgi:undecaprenyl-diphosphatase
MHTALRTRTSHRRRRPSFPIIVRPTKADVAIARGIARDTTLAPEEIARALTRGADEKVLLVLATVGWLASRGCGEPRRAGNQALLVTVAASMLPHGPKLLFDQMRPDRRTVLGQVHGHLILGQTRGRLSLRSRPAHGRSGISRRHVAGRPRPAIRTLAVGLSLTRVAVSAHWASEVVAGFALGAVLERLLRLWTGYPTEISKENGDADA